MLASGVGVGLYIIGVSNGIALGPAGNAIVAAQPGINLPLLVLSALIVFVLYVAYYLVRGRRAGQAQSNHFDRRMDGKESRLFALSQPDKDLKGVPKHQGNPRHFELTAAKEVQTQAVESRQSPQPDRAPKFADDPSWDIQDAVDDDEVTSVPWLNLHDDGATYRLAQAVLQPIVGYFVRATSDPSLPSELRIYGLGPGPGEPGQIHIGRHSKNNTVVINNKNISREHAVVIQKEGRLYLRDNASTAGTYLNWRQLKPGEELLLRNNDIVSFGEIVYKFLGKSEREAAGAGA